MTGMLDGLKVADLSIVTAGAQATQVLADFGADVVKIEGPGRPDLYRHGIRGNQGGETDIDFPPFRVANRNKRGITVDLKTEEGRDVVRRLVAESDVVVENFRRGAVERLGLGFRDLIALRPNIVLVSISSQGATGPNAGFTSFGATLDALGGVMSLTGYDEDTPTWSSGRINYPDQTANTLGAPVILAAVIASRADGKPRWVDMSQREVVTSLLGEEILSVSLGGPAPVPLANSGEGERGWTTRCSGEDDWVAISLRTDADLALIADVVGAEQPTAADPEGALALLRAATARWSAGRGREEVAGLLQAGGVAAAPVRSGEELLADPYLEDIGWWQTAALPDGTTERERGFVVRFAEGGPEGIRRRAPHMGEHTDEVLAELGYSAAEIRGLHERGVVSSEQAVAR